MKRSRVILLTFLASLASGLYAVGPAETQSTAAEISPSAALRPSYRRLFADELHWDLVGWDVGGTGCAASVCAADDSCTPDGVCPAGKFGEVDRAPCSDYVAEEEVDLPAGETLCEFPADLPPYEAAAAAAMATDFGYAASDSYPADLPAAEPVAEAPAESAELGNLVEDARHSAGADQALRLNQAQEGLAVVAPTVASADASPAVPALEAAPYRASYGCGYADNDGCDHGYPCGASGGDEWEWYGCEYEYQRQTPAADCCHDDVAATETAASEETATPTREAPAEPAYVAEVVREDMPVETVDPAPVTVSQPMETGDLTNNRDFRLLLSVAAGLIQRLSETLESVSQELDRVAAELPPETPLIAPADLPPAEPTQAAERPTHEVEYLGL